MPQLVRFGARGRADRAAAGRAGGSQLEIEVTLRPGDAKKARAERRNRCARPSSCAPRSRRSCSRRTGSSWSREGPPPGGRTSTGALGRLFPARAGAAGRVRRGRGAAERRAAPGCDRRLVTRRGRAVDRSGSPSWAGARRGSPGSDRGCSRRGSPSAPGSSASRAGSSATTPSRRRPKRSRLASTTISTAERRASGRTWTTSRSRAGDRDLRRFGSQGEQRLAVLSLILAEAALLAERGPAPPLLLLDDVLSELDEGRRAALAERLAGTGQTLITATAASALPAEPAQLVEVTPGAAR